MYWLLLRSTALPSTAWVAVPYLWVLSTGCYLIRVNFVTSIKSHLWTDQTRQNKKKKIQVSTKTKSMQRQARQVIQMKMRSPAEWWNTEELLKETAEKKVSKNQAKVRHLTVQPWTEHLSMEEAEDVIVNLKNHKPPGEDTICTE
jgi:hypothetical protein